MKVIQSGRARSLCGIAATVFSILACDSVSRADRALIHTDAEVFEAIVRSELPDSLGDSTASRGFLRVDSRPVGDNATLAGSPRPLDLETSSDAASPGTVSRLTEQRRAILKLLRVEEGGPFVYPDCGGTRPRRVKGEAALVGSKCPKEFRRYVTVGLPYRGAAQILDKMRSREAPAPDSTAEVWTVLVAESSIGPGGQDWRQYAWLLRRNPENNRLAPTERFILSWAE